MVRRFSAGTGREGPPLKTLVGYARHSVYTDPGPYAALLESLPADPGELASVVRNVVVHYRAAGIDFTGERLAEVDHRWVDRMLATDQRRLGTPLAVPRPQAERVVGCCRDFTLLLVAMLRHHGIPARSRVGFAAYLAPDFHYDHVVAEYWNGERWVFVDAQLEPGPGWPFDPRDIPHLIGADPPATPLFATAAQVWTAFRAGEVDVRQYGVDPALPLRGGWFVRNYVLHELAHRQRDELLLWDGWGGMAADLDGDVRPVDEVARLLLAADDGDESAERELADRYAADPALHPGTRVRCLSPTGRDSWVDLRTRDSTPV